MDKKFVFYYFLAIVRRCVSLVLFFTVIVFGEWPSGKFKLIMAGLGASLPTNPNLLNLPVRLIFFKEFHKIMEKNEFGTIKAQLCASVRYSIILL